jgi:hypothetical protein
MAETGARTSAAGEFRCAAVDVGSNAIRFLAARFASPGGGGGAAAGPGAPPPGPRGGGAGGGGGW